MEGTPLLSKQMFYSDSDQAQRTMFEDWYLGVAAGGFPTQYAGLRIFSGTMKELCLVAEADAPASMGGVVKIEKGGVPYAVYLVETNDPNASGLRVRTTTGTKAVRLKT